MFDIGAINDHVNARWSQPPPRVVWSLSLFPFQNDAWTPDEPTIEATIAGIADAFPHEREPFSVARMAVWTQRPSTRIGRWHGRDVGAAIVSLLPDPSSVRFDTRRIPLMPWHSPSRRFSVTHFVLQRMTLPSLRTDGPRDAWPLNSASVRTHWLDRTLPPAGRSKSRAGFRARRRSRTPRELPVP